MAAFESFAQFEQYFDEILDIMEDLSTPVAMHQRIIDALESGSESRLSSSLNVSLNLGDIRPADLDNLQVINFKIHMNNNAKNICAHQQLEPCHILCIAMKDSGNIEDDKLGKMFEEFCQQHSEELKRRSIRRITFLALNK